ncbi:hypothetical protein LWM68_37645 [Niabella sp. W65]|nr:hypothetical protein [Niabella sp. W65]MCH7367967.1 hypothetical protein [Niabella sp. W65]
MFAKCSIRNANKKLIKQLISANTRQTNIRRHLLIYNPSYYNCTYLVKRERSCHFD